MLLTITTTHQPATDLGYLLHKRPERVQSFDLSFGRAHVFYPEASAERCTAALLLDVDPIGLVRGKGGPAGEGFALQQYVNDRPYVASSFFSVAIAQVFGSALNGRSADRTELANTAIPLYAKLTTIPCRGGEGLLKRLFEPMGYTITTQGTVLDEKFTDWGASRYFTVSLEATCRLQDLLSHLYVLIPVLDDDKHYWVDHAEVEKLLRHGEGWLPSHPEQELIVNRYLKYQRRLTRHAFAQLLEDDVTDPDDEQETRTVEETTIEERISLNQQRIGSVIAALKQHNVHRIVDLGCGEGKLLQALLNDKEFTAIAGMDVSYRSLEIAKERLRFDRLPPKQQERITLFQGSLSYRDKRLSEYDAATVIEVIEHLDPPRLAALERVLFEYARPSLVVLTTPNVEYNEKFSGLPAGKFRHRDHRFEWTRSEFQTWANNLAQRFGYTVHFLPIGPEDSGVGAPTQMGIFSRE
ncbi:MAG: 3' terminal RNA ribose 2'-O-methyltransferase Hen1 [Deltaproteobacteria bacterium]|nr:3' terminal RNA ribose 2'-O-methyltransferase Hen1 [Deltaproteobacteria bacterium]